MGKVQRASGDSKDDIHLGALFEYWQERERVGVCACNKRVFVMVEISSCKR